MLPTHTLMSICSSAERRVGTLYRQLSYPHHSVGAAAQPQRMRNLCMLRLSYITLGRCIAATVRLRLGHIGVAFVVCCCRVGLLTTLQKA